MFEKQHDESHYINFMLSELRQHISEKKSTKIKLKYSVVQISLKVLEVDRFSAENFQVANQNEKNRQINKLINN